MKRIVIADDHPIVLQGMALLFEDHPEYHIVASAPSMRHLVSACSSENPDLVVLDINLKGKNSLDQLSDFKARFPGIKVLIFSSYNNERLIQKALDLDADGYMLKDAVFEEWMEALENIFDGKKYFSKDLKRKAAINSSGVDKSDSFALVGNISRQEKKIILCIVDGMKEQDIAHQLDISKNTVHTHKKNILKKLSLHSNAEIVKFAYENQLVS